MVPGAVGQAVVLNGDALVGGLSAAGGTGSAMVGVAQVFGVVTAVIGACVTLHAQDRDAVGEHLADKHHLNRPQIASLQKLPPALVGSEASC